MSINRIAPYHLETMLWMDRTGKFSAAAYRFITRQPSVSTRMRELVHLLVSEIFHSAGRTISLPPDGRKLARPSQGRQGTALFSTIRSRCTTALNKTQK